jgi:hypothetical protein
LYEASFSAPAACVFLLKAFMISIGGCSGIAEAYMRVRSMDAKDKNIEKVHKSHVLPVLPQPQQPPHHQHRPTVHPEDRQPRRPFLNDRLP